MSPSAGGAPARLARLLALVPWIVARPGVSVAAVAREFAVPPRQIEDDLTLLSMCGPTPYGGDLIEASFEDGVIHVSNARGIDRPLRLDADEAVTLLVGLRLLAQAPVLRDRDALDRTMAKLESAAGDAARPAAQISVTVDGPRGAAGGQVFMAVQRATDERRRVRLIYYVASRDETTDRDVDPMRLLVVEGHTYLEGWCRRAEAVRLFRMDRVVAAEVLDVAAEVPAEAEQRDLDHGLFQPSPADHLVTFELGVSGRWVAEYYPCETVEELPEGRLRVRLRTPDTRWVRRLALRLGEEGRVVDPPELVAAIRADAAAALAAYGVSDVSSTADATDRPADRPVTGAPVR